MAPRTPWSRPRRASRVRSYVVPRPAGPSLGVLHAVLAGLHRLAVAG